MRFIAHYVYTNHLECVAHTNKWLKFIYKNNLQVRSIEIGDGKSITIYRYHSFTHSHIQPLNSIVNFVKLINLSAMHNACMHDDRRNDRHRKKCTQQMRFSLIKFIFSMKLLVASKNRRFINSFYWSSCTNLV